MIKFGYIDPLTPICISITLDKAKSSVNLNHCCLQLTVSMEMLAEHVRTWGSMDVVHNTYDHINVQLLGITKIAGGNIASMLLVSN